MVRVVRAARTTTRPNRRRTKAGRKRRIKNDFIIVFFVWLYYVINFLFSLYSFHMFNKGYHALHSFIIYTCLINRWQKDELFRPSFHLFVQMWRGFRWLRAVWRWAENINDRDIGQHFSWSGNVYFLVFLCPLFYLVRNNSHAYVWPHCLLVHMPAQLIGKKENTSLNG